MFLIEPSCGKWNYRKSILQIFPKNWKTNKAQTLNASLKIWKNEWVEVVLEAICSSDMFDSISTNLMISKLMIKPNALFTEIVEWCALFSSAMTEMFWTFHPSYFCRIKMKKMLHRNHLMISASVMDCFIFAISNIYDAWSSYWIVILIATLYLIISDTTKWQL